MTLLQQILWGSLFLGICLILHIALLSWCAQVLARLAPRLERWKIGLQLMMMVSVTLAIIVFAHTFQVWIWAFVWIGYDILLDWNSAVYFSLVTYTSLGYGDIVLSPAVRVFGAFASVTGLLSFGLSTAFLVALMTRMFTLSDNR